MFKLIVAHVKMSVNRFHSLSLIFNIDRENVIEHFTTQKH